MKACFKCGKEKPYFEFYKHKQMGDGYLGKCKACTKKDATKNRNDNIERVREYDRNRPNKAIRSIDTANRTRERRKANPKQHKAQCAVNNGIKYGKITRPNKCEGCGIKCKPHAHHWSYEEENWLNVQWLCPVCHMRKHSHNTEMVFHSQTTKHKGEPLF